MKKQKHDKPLYLDMSFDEALKRVAQTDPRDLTKHKAKPAAKRKKVAKKGSVLQRSGEARDTT